MPYKYDPDPGKKYKSLMNRTPNKYIKRAPMRKPRKHISVIGWALRRQFRSPCCGGGCSMAQSNCMARAKTTEDNVL